MFEMPAGTAANKPVVSVIIPTLNEGKNLPLVLPYIPLDVVDEVILVDGRSDDNTLKIAKQLLPSIKVVLESTPGKGAAMRAGYRAAHGDILVVLDADGSNDPREIPRFVQALVEGADLVKGSRFAPSGGTTDMPRLRKLGNWGFTKMVNLMFSQTFTDLLYGFHAFWRHTLEYLDLEAVDGFEVDASIYLQAVRKKLKVVDVPSFEGFRFYGEGKLKTFPDGWRVLRTILREWRSSVSGPQTAERVGFRSYGRVPEIRTIPLTGSPADLDGFDAGGYSFDGQVKASVLENLVHLNDPDLFQQESQAVIPVAVMAVVEELGASSGSMVLLDGVHSLGGFRVFGRSLYPIEEGELDEIITKGVIGWAMENREPVLISNTLEDPRWMNRPWEEEERVARAALIMPIVAGEHVAGILTLTRPADRPFTEDDLERLRMMVPRA